LGSGSRRHHRDYICYHQKPLLEIRSLTGVAPMGEAADRPDGVAIGGNGAGA
jgi:hypothetical protein